MSLIEFQACLARDFCFCLQCLLLQRPSPMPLLLRAVQEQPRQMQQQLLKR
jgi:hypothetical protein